VAYRFFASARRRFIVADTPGHEQYTRNMATGASTANLAVILVDARQGLLTQTRRHTRIVTMLGIRHIVLAVNKMDLVDYDGPTAAAIADEFRAFAASCGVSSVTVIPMSALEGDNVVARSDRMAWYGGPSLMEHLELVEIDDAAPGPFRMPVQWINRPHQDFRGVCGRVAQGLVRPGELIRVLPSGTTSRVQSISGWHGNGDHAATGDSVTLTLADHVDVSRGDVIAAAAEPPEVSDQFEAKLLWMGGHELIPGRPYLLKIHTKEVVASVTALKYRVDVNTGAHLAAKTLALNEIGVVNLSLSQPVVFTPYEVSRNLGGFILIDKLTFETVAAGMIDFALRRASNIHWHALNVDKRGRAAIKHQTPRCVWFTGLSGSGKSTIANQLEQLLHAHGRHTYVLDGDNVRHGLNRDLGFSEADRAENIRRVAEVAKLMVDAGLIVIVAFISPFRAERGLARALFDEGEFLEVFVDAPLDECERRDPKGLYAKARRGDLVHFTGVDSDYEPPDAPDLHLMTANSSIEDCVAQVISRLE
jgi:bifunctional enzyme CysN/CysC